MRRLSRTHQGFILAITAIILVLGATWAMGQDDTSGGDSALGAGNTYIVKQSDVLDLIAAQFDVQTGCLATANELTSPYELHIGQTLRIDFSCPRYDGLAFVENPRQDETSGGDTSQSDAGQGGGSASGDSYTVVRGDVLDLIAAQFDVQTGCLANANELSAPYELHIGQTLTIDLSCPHYDGDAFVENPRSDEELGQGGGGTGGANTYRVERGDVLDLIAAQFDVQTGCLANANDLTAPYELSIGQTLNIDESCPHYDGDAFVANPRSDEELGQGGGGTGGANTYRVERGDVLDLIAAQFDVQTGCLANANDLTAPYELSIGQTLNIDQSCPHYDGDAFVANPRSDEELGQGGGGEATGGANTYRVERGDVLDLIAAQFDVATGCLATANELSAPYELHIGQTLNIDQSCPRYSGEAFVENPRSDEELGQGGGGTGGGSNYVVQRGDVLDLIAMQYNVQVGCLAQANALEAPFRLDIGQTLTIDRSCPAYDGGSTPPLNADDTNG